jgi:hypothetical protein
MQELLASEGIVRVRDQPDEVPAAAAALGRLTAPDHVSALAEGSGWISVQITPDRSSAVNRALYQAGIYAAEMSIGNDLEELFLTLTGESSSTDRDGRFAKIDPSSPALPFMEAQS